VRRRPSKYSKALYGLTEAEARLTSGLLRGERLEDYAARTGISMNTARTHLKSVFAKTDTDLPGRAHAFALANIVRPRLVNCGRLTRRGDAWILPKC
jgi:DNA-binding CsgD family transcriptional regulator